MGSKGGDAEVEVNEYYMSMHVGIAHNADAVTRIYYGEKQFWSGYASTNTKIAVANPWLHGGVKKEGGVAGAIHVLLGGSSQVLPDDLALRLGRASGSNSPGFRGLTSLFFTGGNSGGFYWSANTPYLKPVWATVLRAPKGLNPAKALIGISVLDPSEIGQTSAGWKYKVEALTASGNYSAKTFDDSLWSTGQMPFGDRNGHPNAASFGYTTSINTTWPVRTRIWLRRTFSVTNVYDVGFKIFVDNWVTVWINGLKVLERSGAKSVDFDRIFYVPASYLLKGENKIAILAEDEPESFSLWRVAGHDWGPIGTTEYVYETASEAASAAQASYESSWGPSSRGPYLLSSTPALSAGGTAILYSVSATTGGIVCSVNRTVLSNLDQGYTRAMITVSQNGGVSANANPAHIIYECLTNTDWGMGESSDLIDVASFEACCDTLYAEIFGLSMIWTRQSTVEDFTNEVLKHINGVVFTNPRTGLHTMRLIRGGYDELTLRDVNPDNANLLKFSRRVWGETTNEVVVTWTNPETEKEETVSLQDLGNISMQGAVISASRNYYGVRSKELAMQLAARELRVAASPLCTCDIELDRSAWDILPADVVKLTWPEYGVAGLPMRVGTVDYGRIGDSKVKVTLVEDVFALPVSYFEVPSTTEWQNDLTFPTPVVTSKVFTLPAYASAALAPSGLPSLVYPNAFAGIFAESPDAGSFSFELTGQSVDTLGSTTWVQRSTLSFTSSGALPSAIGSEASSFIASFSSITGPGPSVAGFGLIGDGPESVSEIVLFSAFDTSTGYTVKRGVLDTVPRDWPLGTKIWFFDATANAYDGTTLSAGLSPQYKLLTNASMGQLAITDAPIVTGTISERPHLPLRPANFKVATLGFGTFDAIEMSTVTLTWSNRNRLTEETIVLGWTDGDTPGEAGQTTRIVVTSDTGTVLTTIPALSGTSYVLPLSAYSAVGTIRVKAYSEKDGLISLQAHEIRLINIGVLRKTSTGDVRVIHTGEARFPVLA